MTKHSRINFMQQLVTLLTECKDCMPGSDDVHFITEKPVIIIKLYIHVIPYKDVMRK